MTDSSTANELRTCPDCGGILEPTRPAWAATLDIAAAVAPAATGAQRWRCLLCGYREEAGPAGDHGGQGSAG